MNLHVQLFNGGKRESVVGTRGLWHCQLRSNWHSESHEQSIVSIYMHDILCSVCVCYTQCITCSWMCTVHVHVTCSKSYMYVRVHCIEITHSLHLYFFVGWCKLNLLVFGAMGVGGGLLGALFNCLHSRVVVHRMTLFAAEEWIEILEVKYMYIVCCSELCVQCAQWYSVVYIHVLCMVM